MLFGKRPGELTRPDIERVISEQVPEGSDVEFKAELPAKKGNVEPWAAGQDKIEDRARNELLAEVVAFANTYGGWLLVGIEETQEKPPRAAAVRPVRACVELAERLRLMCRDCIEPRHPTLEVEGVPMQEDGAGVVAFHVPRSRMAPHRLRQTKDCYRRHADRTEVMDMREIQDLTLQVERGMAAVDRRFRERQQGFTNSWSKFVGNFRPLAFGLRAALVPLTPLYVERVYNNNAVLPPARTFYVNDRSGQSFPINIYDRWNWMPVVRGALNINVFENWDYRRAVFCHGLIEYCAMEQKIEERPFGVNPSEVMATAANAILAAELFRRAAGAPDVEYGLEIEIRTSGGEVPVADYGNSRFIATLSADDLFPMYSIGQKEEFGKIWSMIERDFWNAANQDGGGELSIDFDRAFREIGLIGSG